METIQLFFETNPCTLSFVTLTLLFLFMSFLWCIYKNWISEEEITGKGLNAEWSTEFIDDFSENLFKLKDSFVLNKKDKKVIVASYLLLMLITTTLLCVNVSYWFAFLVVIIIFPQITTFIVAGVAFVIFQILKGIIVRIPRYIYKGIRNIFE